VNELNYASLEASQRLHEKGIVLETDVRWYAWIDDGYQLLPVEYFPLSQQRTGSIPAPSMAEVWRELPEYSPNHDVLTMQKDGCGYFDRDYFPQWFGSENIIDALIDLLIWVVEQRKEEGKWMMNTTTI
jgi:hypothetical protein